MKILKYGENNTKLATMEVSCTGQGIHSDKIPCGSLLEITGLDIKSAIHHDYGGGSDTYYFIICPVCGTKTEVYYSKIPKEISQFLK